MQIDNKRIIGLLKFLMVLSVLAIALDIGINYIQGQASEWLPGYKLTYFIIGFHVILAFFGVNTFTFKDDYEILMIYSKNFYALPSWGWAHSYHEFPKRKLLGYRIKKFLFFRFVQLHLDSKEEPFFTSNINATWISSEDLNKLENCLEETVRNYQKESSQP